MQDLLDAMAKNQADFTLTFRRLGDAAGDADDRQRQGAVHRSRSLRRMGRALARSASPTEPQSAAERQAAMRAVNPAFIPRNHRVEAVIQAAVNNDDYAPFEELLTVLAKPFEDQPDVSRPTPSRRCRSSACCRRSAGRERLSLPRSLRVATITQFLKPASTIRARVSPGSTN